MSRPVRSVSALEHVQQRRRFSRTAEIWFWAVCIFLLTTPFYFQITGTDPVAGAARNLSTGRATEGTQLPLYLLRVAIMALALASIAPRWRAALTSLRQMAPVGAFLTWAAASLIWTDSFGATLNGVISLSALILVGFCLSVRLPPHHAARALLCSGLVMAVLSVIWVLVLPRYGVHQQADASQAIHAGAWRGVYIHKNHLGQVSAIYAGAVITSGPSVIRSKLLKTLTLLLLLLLIARSRSASSIVVLAAAPVMTWMLLRLRGARQAVVLLLAAAVVIIASTSLAAVLEMLGRDTTLTGRTDIWKLALDGIESRPAAGFGFMSATYGGIAQLFFERGHVLDPHNGFLDLTLGLGLIGLLLILTCFIASARSAQRLRTDSETGDAALAFFGALMGWIVAGNAESDFRPLGAVGAIGYLSLTALLAARAKARGPVLAGPRKALFSPAAARAWAMATGRAPDPSPADAPEPFAFPAPIGSPAVAQAWAMAATAGAGDASQVHASRPSPAPYSLRLGDSWRITTSYGTSRTSLPLPPGDLPAANPSPKVSVVIPAYDAARHLPQAIQSVRAQTMPDWELIIVDDCSPIDPAPSLAPLLADPRIRLVRLDANGGASAARNFGISLARGRFVAFLDADDSWAPSKLERQLAAVLACADPERVFCVTQTVVQLGLGRHLIRPIRPKRAEEALGDFIFVEGGFCQTSSFLLSRRLASEIGFRSLTTGEDHLFAIDACRAGAAYLLVEEPLVTYNNDPRPGRLSNENQLRHGYAFLTATADLLSERARLAYEIRYMGVRLLRETPVKGLSTLVRALRRGALKPRFALFVVLRAMTPSSVYNLFRTTALGRRRMQLGS